MSLSKKQKRSVGNAQVAEIAGEAFFGEYSNCRKCNLVDINFPKNVCDHAAVVLGRSTTEMKTNFISMLIIELENDRNIHEYSNYTAESSILKSVIGDALGMIPCYTSVEISRKRGAGLRMKILKMITGGVCEYFFVGDELKSKCSQIPKEELYNKSILSKDLFSLLNDLNWNQFSDTPGVILYYDGKAFSCTKPPENYFEISTNHPIGPNDKCVGWIDVSHQIFTDYLNARVNVDLPTFVADEARCLVNLAGDIFFGNSSNCTKCNLLDAGFPSVMSTNASIYEKMHDDEIQEFCDYLYTELENSGCVHEFSTFEARTNILKVFVGNSLGMIPTHTSINIKKSPIGFTMVVRRGYYADLLVYYFDNGVLKQKTIKNTKNKLELSKRLCSSKIAKEVLAAVNIEIINDQKLIYYDGYKFYKTRPENMHIVFGPNVFNVFDEDQLVSAWVNTNFYSIDKWTKHPFLCISYFGGADLNALKAAEFNCTKKWKRVTVDSMDVICNGDVICFVGTLCDWILYTKNNLTITPKNTEGVFYKHVYVYCVLIGEPLPQFTTNINNSEWVLKNICFETAEYKVMYDQLASDGELEYYSDTILKPDAVYAVFLPRPQTKHEKSTTTNVTTTSTYEIKIKCMELCSCKTVRKNVNILVHHGDEHCKTPHKCCVLGCRVVFGLNQKSKRRDHYRKCHKIDPVSSKVLFSKPALLAKSKDLMRDAWQIGAQLKLITTTPIIGMDTEMITDKFIYLFFMTELDKLQDQQLAYTIMYVLGMNIKEVSIGNLILGVTGAGVFRTRDKIVSICRELAEFNVIEISNTYNKYQISHNQLRMITDDNSLCETVYLKRLVLELISNFCRCIFNIENLRSWFFLNAAAKMYKDDQIQIADEIYTAFEYREFLVMFHKEIAPIENQTETKWFMLIDGKLHVHLHLLLSDAAFEKSTDTPIHKFVRLIVMAIQKTYIDTNNELIQNRQRIKERFLMSYDLTLYSYAHDIIFDLATIVFMQSDRNSNFLIAVVTKKKPHEIKPPKHFDQIKPPMPFTLKRLRHPTRKPDRILFNVTDVMPLLNKNFKHTPSYTEFRLFSNVCNVFRCHNIPTEQLERFKQIKLKGMFTSNNEIYICLSLMVEPAQSVALALLEYSGRYHFDPRDDLKNFNKNNCTEIFINGIQYLQAAPFQENIYERIVVDLTDEISYFINEIIEMEGNLRSTTDVVIISNIGGVTNEIINNVSIVELMSIRDGTYPGYMKIWDTQQQCEKMYCHLPSMELVGRRIAIALMNYSTAYYNDDDDDDCLLAGDRFSVCINGTQKFFYKALAYRPKHPISNLIHDFLDPKPQDHILPNTNKPLPRATTLKRKRSTLAFDDIKNIPIVDIKTEPDVESSGIVFDVTDVLYYVSSVISGDQTTVDLEIISNIEKNKLITIKAVDMSLLVDIRDCVCPGFFKCYVPSQRCIKVYAHLPSMSPIALQIVNALLSYDASYHNFNVPINEQLVLPSTSTVRIGERTFNKALAYQAKVPIIDIFSDDIPPATPQDTMSNDENTSTVIKHQNKTNVPTGTGIYMACAFDLDIIEDISDIITDELLKKYPLLKIHHTEITNDLSTIYTLLDTKKMYIYWENKHWPYKGIITGNQIKSNKIYNDSICDPIYTVYPKTNLKSIDLNQFPQLVKLLSETERDVLTLAYECYFSEDITQQTQLRMAPEGVKMRLIQLGFCLNGPTKLLFPNTNAKYATVNMQHLNQYKLLLATKSVMFRGTIVSISKKNISEIMEPIQKYEEGVDYRLYFYQFHDPMKISVNKNKINFVGRMLFIDLLKMVDPRYLYNIHSFLEYVDVVGYHPKGNSVHSSWGLIVAMKASMKYKTNKCVANPSPYNFITHSTCVEDGSDDENYIWSARRLEKNKNQEHLYTDHLTTTSCGFKWLLANLDKPISKQFTRRMVAKILSKGVYSVTYLHLTESHQSIESKYFCRICVQFGNSHHTDHMGIQFQTKLKLRVLCAACKIKYKIGRDLNFGTCQGENCGVDVYANTCEKCTKKIKGYLCKCCTEPPENKCLPGEHTGYLIHTLYMGANQFCDFCKEYQGDAQSLI